MDNKERWERHKIISNAEMKRFVRKTWKGGALKDFANYEKKYDSEMIDKEIKDGVYFSRCNEIRKKIIKEYEEENETKL